MIVAPLESACIELLVINKYLDEEDDFYDMALNYLTKINSISATLPHWGTHESKELVEN